MVALINISDGYEWDRENVREVARLAHGCGPDMPAGTNTIFFVDHKLKPSYKKFTYIYIVITERLYMKETKQVRCRVWGGCIQYDGDLDTPIANLTTVKFHLNSIISTHGSQYSSIDIN